MQALLSYFHGRAHAGQTALLIARTHKGQGLCCAQDRPEWHHKVPDDAQLQEAYRALGVEGVDWLG